MSKTRNVVHAFGIDIHGVAIDERTGCAHYRSPLDIVAIRHACCGEWYACIECHRELADHPVITWPKAAFDTYAVFCAACGAQATIAAYLRQPDQCLTCGAPFNPGCRLHHHLYFEQ